MTSTVVIRRTPDRLAGESSELLVTRRAVLGGGNDCTVSKEFLWLWQGDSSVTQEGERPPLKFGSKRRVKYSRLRRLIVFVVKPRLCELARELLSNCNQNF